MANEISIKEYVDRRFEEQEKAVKAALASAETAVNKAEVSAERWRNNANEWRGAMADRERDFLSRKEFYSIIGTAVGVIGVILMLRSRI